MNNKTKIAIMEAIEAKLNDNPNFSTHISIIYENISELNYTGRIVEQLIILKAL